jgi:predicted nucleic acid-binding protein
MLVPSRIFLDTNVYIIGSSEPESPEKKILDWLGFSGRPVTSTEVILSDELVEQICRVAKRLRNKDWSGELLNRIWRNLRIVYVQIDEIDIANNSFLKQIPREDIGVYLTAIAGQAEYFISANYELIRALANKTGDFTCFTAEQFIDKYHLK